MRKALMTGSEVKVATPAGGTISIEWYQPEVASTAGIGAMLTELPKVELPDSCAKIENVEVTTDHDAVGKVSSPAVLRQYIEAVQYTILGYFVDRKASDSRTINVKCEITPGNKVSWNMSSTPQEDKIELKGIELRLADLPTPAVNSDKVEFQLVLAVAPKA
jgi:hypothetical protein